MWTVSNFASYASYTIHLLIREVFLKSVAQHRFTIRGSLEKASKSEVDLGFGYIHEMQFQHRAMLAESEHVEA